MNPALPPDAEADGEPAPAASATRHDRLKQLRALCETVRHGSIAGAARAMGASQPVVSNQLRALEKQLGVALINRQGARAAPTRAGESLHHIALPLVEGLLRLPALFEEHHRGGGAGTLRIGAGEVSGGGVLPDLVARFQARWPGTRVEVRTGSGRERLEWLRRFELDIVIASVEPVPADIEFHSLVKVDTVVITPLDHPLAGRHSVAIEELAGHAMVALNPRSYARRIHDLVLGLHGVRARVVAEVEEWGSMINCVAAGVGIAAVPRVCVSEHEPVHTVAIEHWFHRRSYGVATRRGGLVGLAARRFIEVVVPGAPEER